MRTRSLWIATKALLAPAVTLLVLDRPSAAGQTSKAKAVTRVDDKASQWIKGKLANTGAGD
jgi:hypothetical protein